MAITLSALTPVEDSLFLTLCCRALDHRRERPILGDAKADAIVGELEYHEAALNSGTNLVLNVALRAKKLDDLVNTFIQRHPDAIGLDLGAGLDSRAERLAPPATIDWYDVDLPAVAAVREQLLPGHDNVSNVAGDVTDPHWLDAIPGDRPAVIVADGLMGFLSRDEMAALLNLLVAHFPSGEMAFNSYTRFAIWAAKHSPGTKTVADLVKFPGFDDPREFESWNPKLTLVREILMSREPELAAFPAALRWYYRLSAKSTAWSRKGTVVLHYRF